MTLLERIQRNAKSYGKEIAYHYEGPDNNRKELTWEQLNDYSDMIAEYLEQTLKTKKPVIVYGHKDPFMIVCFLACTKSGRAYCPIDIFQPPKRTLAIAEVLQPELIFNVSTETFPAMNIGTVLGMEWLEEFVKRGEKGTLHEGIKKDEVFYIIFTSGSTGIPKGVQITTGCLEHFLDGAMKMGSGIDSSRRNVFINEVPFSFDVSVMDLYLSLYSGGTVWVIDKALFSNVRALTKTIVLSKGTILVATPSFVKLCLADDRFSEKYICGLEKILFCGEVLPNKLVRKIRERFRNVEIINSYGPTETTVAVTDILITEEIEHKYDPLPIGRTRQGVWVTVETADGECVPEGEKGEIVIAGKTVGKGYFNDRELTQKAFHERYMQGEKYRIYRSGDIGYIKDGYLFYSGRIDSQIKLNGYRIETGDIENNLLKIDEIEQAVVIPHYKEGQVKSIIGYVIYTGKEKEPSLFIKQKVREYLPEYMIPQKIKVVPSLPLTNNGKIDRQLLSEIENGSG